MSIQIGDRVIDTKYGKEVVADHIIVEAAKRISGRWKQTAVDAVIVEEVKVKKVVKKKTTKKK